jgi:hypothetical protein
MGRDTEVYGMTLLVASLEDVIHSKEPTGRERDRALPDDLHRTLKLKRRREHNEA